MNIFVVDRCPIKSAQILPDKHVVKMSLEACQMISIIYSSWFFNWGVILKADGLPYSTFRGIFKKHPATLWAAASHANLAWLIVHGQALCAEYAYRYNKIHACAQTLQQAANIFEQQTGKNLDIYQQVTDFVRVMPEQFANDHSMDMIIAYRKYVASKSWVADNYRTKPDRKPAWITEK